MSEDKTPEWMRLRNELLSQMRGLWDEMTKLSDWIWHVEKKTEELERRIEDLEQNVQSPRRSWRDRFRSSTGGDPS